MTREELEKLRDALAKEFCATWPSSQYAPHDLELFYERGFDAAVSALVPDYERRLGVAREAIRFVVEREDLSFAECSVAEEIWRRCKEALAALEGEK